MMVTSPSIIEDTLRTGLGVCGHQAPQLPLLSWRDTYGVQSDLDTVRNRVPVGVLIDIVWLGGSIQIAISRDIIQFPAWFPTTAIELAKFLLLEPNWDSYGGLPVSTKSVEEAFKFLLSTAEDRLMSPSVVPTSEGGVQLEWHTSGIDLELEIPPTGAVFAYLRRLDGGEQEETGQEAIHLVKDSAPRQPF